MLIMGNNARKVVGNEDYVNNHPWSYCELFMEMEGKDQPHRTFK